jgi:electron transport complex protein RnfC
MKHSIVTGAAPQLLQGKQQSAPSIHTIALPPTLVFPAPAAGNITELLVETGQYVAKGQALTHSEDYLQPPLHASSSGTVTRIDSDHIIIATDGRDETVSGALPRADTNHRGELAECAHRAGLIGHGGAGYPLAAKLSALHPDSDLLLINAAECDPSIYCDEALITDSADAIIRAIQQIAAYCDISRVCVGLEDNKPGALAALTGALKQLAQTSTEIELRVVPAQYPSGAERTLLKQCTTRTPGTTESLAANGVLSMNIATAFALGEALATGHPCLERITTVIAPDGSVHNFRLRLGTPIRHLYQQLDVPEPLEEPGRITSGGSMMYERITGNDAITQTSNCIIFEKQASDRSPARPCIRCGACADVCPEQLMPQHLHTHAVHFNQQQLIDHRLEHCIKCRCCDVVCPSHIPLASQFKSALTRLQQNRASEAEAATAQARYEKRLQRLAKQEVRSQRERRKQQPTANSQSSSRKALIEAALARTQQKKNERAR